MATRTHTVGIGRRLRVLGWVTAVMALAALGRPAAQTPPVRDIWLHLNGDATPARLTTTSDPARASGAASISGDGRLIVFQSQSDFAGHKVPDKTTEIWLYDVPARRLTRVTTSSEPGRISMNPAISTDGSTVVFDSDSDLLKEGVPRGQQEIWSYKVATGQLTRLTRGGARAISSRPATNADGSVVAFHSNVIFDGDGSTAAIRDMWLITPASPTPVRVTRAAGVNRIDRPALDAAGHTLVFETDASLGGHQVPSGQVEIWMYDVRGREIKRLTDAADPSRVSQNPSISADGRRVAFQSQADLGRNGHPDSVDEIWLYDRTKDGLERLTNAWVPARDAGRQAVVHPDCQNARITADGQRVIFASDADFLAEKKVVNGYPHVWVLDLPTKALQRVDTTVGSGSGIAISADASRIALFRSSFDDFRLANVSPQVSGPPRPEKLSAAEVRTDLDAFEKELTERWAYLKANGVDLRGAVSRLREKSAGGIDTNTYGLELQKIISMFIDGHSGVSGFARPPGSLPFFIEHTNGRFLAIKPDRTAFYEAQLPFITRIDGRPIQEWLKIAEPFNPQGSPQYKQWRGLRLLTSLAFLRQQAGAPAGPTARVEFVSEDGGARRDVDVPVGAAVSSGGTWPRTQSAIMAGNVGYLRIASMGSTEADDVMAWMPKFRDTRGLIVDVRGNGGGSRDALRALFPYLMSEKDAPRVANAAKHRLHPSYGGEDFMGGSRFMWVETSPEWTPEERAAIAAFKKTFKPEWTPPPTEFSEWHYLVMSRKTNPKAFVYGKPVIVLLDEKCFSATDIFLSALKGWHDVTLMGYASGGGSARQVGVSMPVSRMSFTLASMASFQWTGQLYDTRGIHPDVVVHPAPGYFLMGGKDNILEDALRRLK